MPEAEGTLAEEAAPMVAEAITNDLEVRGKPVRKIRAGFSHFYGRFLARVTTPHLTTLFGSRC